MPVECAASFVVGGIVFVDCTEHVGMFQKFASLCHIATRIEKGDHRQVANLHGLGGFLCKGLPIGEIVVESVADPTGSDNELVDILTTGGRTIDLALDTRGDFTEHRCHFPTHGERAPVSTSPMLCARSETVSEPLKVVTVTHHEGDDPLPFLYFRQRFCLWGCRNLHLQMGEGGEVGGPVGGNAGGTSLADISDPIPFILTPPVNQLFRSTFTSESGADIG